MRCSATFLVCTEWLRSGNHRGAPIAATTTHAILAAGRRADKLQSSVSELPADRVQPFVLDATDLPALREACSNASFVINAIGPFARTGAAIARTAVECARPYLDCANEQIHYRSLGKLDASARTHKIPLITAAGGVPGLTTLLSGRVYRRYLPPRQSLPDRPPHAARPDRPRQTPRND